MAQINYLLLTVTLLAPFLLNATHREKLVAVVAEKIDLQVSLYLDWSPLAKTCS